MKVYPTDAGVAEEGTGGGALRARFLISRAFESLWVRTSPIIIIILQLSSRPMPLFDCYSRLRTE